MSRLNIAIITGAMLLTGVSHILFYNDAWSMPLAIGWFLLAIPQAGLVIAFRRRIIIRLGRPLQWCIAAGLTGLSAAAFALFYKGL